MIMLNPKVKFPPAGAAFLIPIREKVFTFAWVVGPHVIEDNPYRRVSLACADWTGSAPPKARDLVKPKVRDCRDIRGKSFGPLVLDTHEAVGKEWKRVGTVRPPEVPFPPDGGGGLERIQYYVQRMWQAEHEPESLAAEIAILEENERNERAEERVLAKRLAPRKKGPLKKLASVDLLPEWDGLATARRRTMVSRWLRECVLALCALPPKAKRAQKLAVIAAAVEKINDWPGSSEIDTPEREALCDAIDDIGRHAGLRGHDLAGPYRDW